MRAPFLGTLAAATLAMAACAPATEVHTVVAPDAGLSTLRTFRVVPAHAGYSPASRALGDEITGALTHRGYFRDDGAPDLLVEYGVAAPEELDPTDWAYDYTWRPDSWRDWGPASSDATPSEYADGALVIDVKDARTGQLLWRGHAVADLASDERIYVRRMDRTVTAILGRLPEGNLATK